MPKPYEQWPQIMYINDVVDCTGLPINQVHELFRRRDFPLLIPGRKRCRTVHKTVLNDYLQRQSKPYEWKYPKGEKHADIV